LLIYMYRFRSSVFNKRSRPEAAYVSLLNPGAEVGLAAGSPLFPDTVDPNPTARRLAVMALDNVATADTLSPLLTTLDAPDARV
jgi:hypothetical protein